MKRICDARAVGRSASSNLLRNSGLARPSSRETRRAPAPSALIDSLEQRQLLAIVTNPGQAIADQIFSRNGGAIVIDLASRYNDNGITGTIVRFNTTSGFIDVELFNQPGGGRTRTTPLTVANFLSYANDNRYDNTVIHRSVPGFIVQGGGFALPTSNNSAPTGTTTDAPVLNEPGNSNIRGTIAMAKLGGDPNSATNQWFFNLADNRTTLDGQNGGFTVFGRIINGISIPDSIAALRRFDFGSPFNELPVRASYDGQTIRPADFVNVSDVSVNGDRAGVVNQSLTYTITSSNPALATARLYNGRLVVAPGAGQDGTATITVRITGIDGQFADDTFDVTVTANEAAAQLAVTPVPINGVGGAFTLTSGGTTFTDPNVASVSYYLDANRDGAFDMTDTLLGTDGSSAGGFTLAGTATGFAGGANLVFARGTLIAGGNTAVVSQIVLVNAAPTVGSVTSNPAVITSVGATITLTANNVADADSGVTNVRFYRDADGNGTLDTTIDTLLGTDDSSAGGYTLTMVSTAGFTSGTALNRIFAIATDAEGATSVPVSTTVRINVAPVITVFGPAFAAVRPATATISATVTDDGGNITSVQFFRDTNGNGIFDIAVDGLLGTDSTAAAGGVYSITFNTSGQPLGALTIFARAIDADGGTSDAPSAILTITSSPPRVLALTRSPDPVSMVGATLRLTATGVTDPDSTIANVRFYFGPTSLMVFDITQVTLFGEDTSPIGGFTFTGALTEALGFAPGSYKFFAVATDTDGTPTANAGVPSVTVRINARPTIGSLTSNLDTVARLARVIFTANTVADDATVTRVNFYRDVNGDGVLNTAVDRLIGSDSSAIGEYTLNVATTGYTEGINTIFATAVDNNGGVSDVAVTTITVTNVPPIITSVSSTPRPVVQLGRNVTLTSVGQRDTDGRVAEVRFFLETNGEPGRQDDDFLLGIDNSSSGGFRIVAPTNASDGWVEGNNNLIYGQVVDNDGGTTSTDAITVTVNPRPTIASLSVSNSDVTRRDIVTYTANDVVDDGIIRRVEFYRDVNDNGIIDIGTDRLLGSDSLAMGGYTLTLTTAGFATGDNTVLARAIDNFAATSATVSVDLEVANRLPTITSGTVRASPLPFLGQAITITANGAADLDGSISTVLFFLETNGTTGLQTADIDGVPADRLLGEDTLAAGGYSLVVATTSLRGFQVGSNTVYTCVVDNDGDNFAVPTTFTITATNGLPNVSALTAPIDPVARGTRMTLAASGIEDSDAGDTVRAVEFYRDRNGNGQIDVNVDQLLGRSTLGVAGVFTLANIDTRAFSTFDNVIMVRAQDNKNAFGETFTGTVGITNVLPVAPTLVVTPAVVGTIGGNVTLIAGNVRDIDGSVSSVQFYRDNGDERFDIETDALLGSDASAVGGYKLTIASTAENGFSVGAVHYFARTIDNEGTAGNASAIVSHRINAAPTIGAIVALPAMLSRSATYSLTAQTVTDSDSPGANNNNIRSVRFFFDTNGNGILDAADRLLGSGTRLTSTSNWIINRAGNTLPTTGSTVRVFAQVTDTDNATNVFDTVFDIIP